MLLVLFVNRLYQEIGCKDFYSRVIICVKAHIEELFIVLDSFF